MPGPRHRTRSSGFTLLEMMIVMAIIALMLGSAVTGFKSLAKSDLRAATAHLSGAVRFLFDRASTTGKHHRLVLDLNEGRYWAEISDDKFYSPHDAETEFDRRKREEAEEKQDVDEKRKAEEAAKRSAEGYASSSSFDPSRMEVGDYRPKRVRFAAFKETTIKPVTLKNAKLVDVYTPRLTEPVTAGRAYVYFFPMGQTEPTIIHMSDKSGESFYSIVVHPATGRVRIYNEYIKPPINERTDDEGTLVTP